MNSKAIIGIVLCVVLLISGTALLGGSLYQRSIQLRGWALNSAEVLPDRLPLAGVNVELNQYTTDVVLDQQLESIARAGFTWVRQRFDWALIESTQGRFEFTAYDRLVAAVAKQPSLKLIAVLDSAPAWARRLEGSDRLFAPPASMESFATFATALAQRYTDRLDYYQIWDEPNLNTHWGGLDPRPADYVAMLKAAYPAIHHADPVAIVIAAGLAPTVELGPRNISDVVFLRAMYEAGVKGSLDAIAGKPYGFDSSPLDRTTDEQALNFSRLILLREVLLHYGDGDKPVWASHFGWNSLPAGWSGSPSIWGQVDAATRRDYTRQAYIRAAQEWPWTGGLILEAWQPATSADDPRQGFAIQQVAADWFEDGQFFRRAPFSTDALNNGLYAPTDPRLHYTGDWDFGPLGADVRLAPNAPTPPEDGSAHQLNFSFMGDTLAFQVRRNDYVAFLYVTVDGQPANALPHRESGAAYIMLKSPDLQPHTDTIIAAQGLGAGVHQATVKFYLGYDQWVLAGIQVINTPDVTMFNFAAVAGGLALLLGVGLAVVLVRRVPRTLTIHTQHDAVAYLRRMGDYLLGIIASALALIGIFLTFNNILPNLFRRDTPTLLTALLSAGLAYFSPSFVLALAMLLIVWLIVYNRPIVGLALVLFWAPFFLAPYELYLWSFPMVEIMLVLTVSAVLAHSLISYAQQRRIGSSTTKVEVKWTLVDSAMLAFVVVASVSLLWAEQRAPALRTWRTMVIEPTLLYILVRRLRLSTTDLTQLVDMLLLGAVVVVVLGLYQFFTGTSIVIAEGGARRLTSVYWSPNNAALFLGRCLPYALAMALLAPTVLRRWVAWLVSGLLLLAILLTQSVGALLLGVPIALITVLWLWNRRVGQVAIFLTVLALVALIPLSRFVPRLRGVLDMSRSSSFIRTQIWTSAYYLLRDRPLTGAGLDQFLYLYRSRYIQPDAWREPNLSHPHNVVLDYWVSLGILGLAVFTIQQTAFWRTALTAWRRARDHAEPMALALAIGAMGSMANFLAHGMVDNSYFVIDLAFVFCFTLALVMQLRQPAT